MKTIPMLVLALAVPGGVAAAERAIEKEVLVKATPAALYEAWTTREGITSFFAPDAKVEARPDGAFAIYINPYAEPGMKGADDMRFLALQQDRMVSFTWNAPPSLPEARAQRTAVIVRFEPASETGTRVTLTHVGWGNGGQWDDAYRYFDRAWGGVLDALQKRFETGERRDWTEWLQRMKDATPKK